MAQNITSKLTSTFYHWHTDVKSDGSVFSFWGNLGIAQPYPKTPQAALGDGGGGGRARNKQKKKHGTPQDKNTGNLLTKTREPLGNAPVSQTNSL